MNKKAKLGKGILLRGTTYWYRRMVEGKHLQISLHTSDPVEALRIATDIKNPGSVAYASAKKATTDSIGNLIHPSRTCRTCLGTLPRRLIVHSLEQLEPSVRE